MNYSKQTWVDGPDGGTPLTSARLNYMEDGIAEAEATYNKATPGGYASLDGAGKVPAAQIPAIAIGETFVVADEVEMLALDPALVDIGDVAIRLDTDTRWLFVGDDITDVAQWHELHFPEENVETVLPGTGIETSGTTNVTVSLNAATQSTLAEVPNKVEQSAFDSHAVQHQFSGSDPINVSGLSGELADPQTPLIHGNEAHSETFVTHDTISLQVEDVSGLSGANKVGADSNTIVVWSMPDATDSLVLCAFEAVADWTTYSVKVVFTNLAINAGDVVFRFDTGHLTEGNTVTTVAGTEAIVAAPLENARLTTTVASGVSAPSGDATTIGNLHRLGSSVDDTLDNPVGIVAVIYEKES